MVNHLEKILGRLRHYEQILTITPGRISKTRAHNPLTMKIQYSMNADGTQWKLLVLSKKAVQEIFLTTFPISIKILQEIVDEVCRKIS